MFVLLVQTTIAAAKKMKGTTMTMTSTTITSMALNTGQQQCAALFFIFACVFHNCWMMLPWPSLKLKHPFIYLWSTNHRFHWFTHHSSPSSSSAVVFSLLQPTSSKHAEKKGRNDKESKPIFSSSIFVFAVSLWCFLIKMNNIWFAFLLMFLVVFSFLCNFSSPIYIWLKFYFLFLYFFYISSRKIKFFFSNFRIINAIVVFITTVQCAFILCFTKGNCLVREKIIFFLIK